MLVQYFLVDHSLKMRRGKACAQCVHASRRMSQYVHRGWGKHLAETLSNPSQIELQAVEDFRIFFETYKEWEHGAEPAAVVLKSDTEGLQRALEEFRFAVELRDAGKTEVAPNTRTVVVLPIMNKTDAPDWIRALKPL